MTDKLRPEEQEFYEAMPGTMDRTHMGTRVDGQDERAEREDSANRRSILPWLLIPAALILAWAVWNGLQNNSSNLNTGSTNNGTVQSTTDDQGTSTGSTDSMTR